MTGTSSLCSFMPCHARPGLMCRVCRSMSSSYRALVMETVGPDEVDAIRRHVQCQHAYGSNRFRAAIDAQLGRSAGPRKIGRPKKSD